MAHTAHRPKPRTRRGTAVIAVVIMLALLAMASAGMILSGGRDHHLTTLRIDELRATYAAHAGVEMSMREIVKGNDFDLDRNIGTVSNDANTANDPALASARFASASLSASGNARSITVQGRCGLALAQVKLNLRQDGTTFLEGWEGYPVGTQMHNLNGWAGWDNNAGAGALTAATPLRQGIASVDIAFNSDLVHEYNITTGNWRFTAWQYIPSSASGADTYFILLNQYAAGGAKVWCTQIKFSLASNQVYDNVMGGVTGNVLTLVRDAWVPIFVDMNFSANTQTVYYNNQLLFSSTINRRGGPVALAAVDLYGSTIDHVFYDDITIAPPGNMPPMVLTGWQQTDPRDTTP